MAEVRKMSKAGALKVLELQSEDSEYIVTLGTINKFFEDYDVTDTKERVDIINNLVKIYKD